MATRTTVDRDTAELQQRTARIEEKIDHMSVLIEDLHESSDDTCKWREGVDTERRLWRYGGAIIVASFVTMFVNSCNLHPNVSPLVTPEPPIVATPVPTAMPTPTADPTPTATDVPMPEPSCTQTPDWAATPTPITQTPAIIEITPLGGERKVTGTYTTLNNQRSRACPGIECDVVRTISAGQTLRFYDWRSWLPLEAWVCISVSCGEWMASTYEGKEMGDIHFDQ